MYVRTRESLGLGVIPCIKGPFSSYLGEPKPSKECLRYEKGEREKSHCQEGPCQQGHLVADVPPSSRPVDRRLWCWLEWNQGSDQEGETTSGLADCGQVKSPLHDTSHLWLH